MPKLIVPSDAPGDLEFDLDGVDLVTIGRDKESDIVLKWRMASRRHATVVARDGRYYVIDGESYNGTFVNSRPVRETELRHGDEITIASSLLRFVVPELAEQVTQQQPLVKPGSAPLEPEALDPAAVTAIPAATTEQPELTVDDLVASDTSTEPELSSNDLAGVELDASLTQDDVQVVEAKPPRPERRRVAGQQPGRRRRPWPIVGIALVVVALVIFLLQQRGRRVGADEATASPPTAQDRALAEAIQADGDTRIDLLWEFLSSYPQSRHRAAAYIGLLDAGATRSVVCGHAASSNGNLLQENDELSDRCN